jgi:dienelactone hydrolase
VGKPETLVKSADNNKGAPVQELFEKPGRLMVLALAGVVLGCAATAVAELKTETIEYSHGDVRCKGYLAYDEARPGKRPGVLVVHEWWGLNDYAKRRTRELAALGYLALAADMYGDGRVVQTAEQAAALSAPFRSDRALARGRAAAALQRLREHPLCDPARLAAIGYCFGGMIVLELARSGAELAGVVSFHGSLATQTPATAGQLKARVLVCHGADDPFVSAGELAAFASEMRNAGADWQLVSYGGAVHSFTNPEADHYNIAGAAYNARADRRSWEAMKLFFAEIFK